ncbi:MAG: fluoride efflux transporter CrcB [Verrucomicrobiales bacterium]
MDSLWARAILVACGGGLGAVLRWGLDSGISWLWPAAALRFPVGIFVVNGLGCLVFGLILGLAGSFETLGSGRRLFLLTGVLGGFTTFSTFSHDTVRLLGAGQTGLALINAVGSVVVGLGAVLGGLAVGRWLAG